MKFVTFMQKGIGMNNLHPKETATMTRMPEWRIILFLLFLIIAAIPNVVHAQTSNPVPVQFFYVPIPEDQLLLALQTVQSGAGTAPSNPIQTYMSLAATSDNTVIYYDQWENGYEPDISNPLNLYSTSNPGGTQIWGDGNPANGVPPGVPSDIINSGTVILLNNPVTTTNLLAIDFDGGDKIAATKTIAMVRSGWSTGPNTLLAAANETYDTDNWGTSFVVPAGEDMPTSFDNRIFGYTGVSIMAGVGGANVQVDADANGSYELSFSLAEGKAYLVNGGVNVGAKILASKPVQVDLLTGDRGEQYETRFFGVTPTNLLYSEYYTPVSTPSSAQGTSGTSTVVFLYNPNSSSITVNYTTRTGSGGNTLTTVPITVTAGGYAKQVIPDGYGASFVSANGSVFHALSATDADNSSTSTGGNRTWDWGYTLIGNGALTPQVLVGLGIGRDPTSSTNPNENGNPIWVTPVGNGNTPVTIYIDYDADPTTGPLTDPNGNKYNTSISLRELDRAKVYDANDNNQTGMLLYTLTNGVKLAAAWGQDPLVASASAPGLDMGTGIPPVPLYDAGKNGTLYQDNDGDGFISPGDVLEYKIVLNNISRAPVPDITVIDNLPVDVTYVPNSTKFKNHLGTITAIADDGSGTAFPLDGLGKLVNPSSALPVGKSYEVTFRVTIKNFEALTPGITTIVNNGHADAVGTMVEFTAHTPLFGRIGNFVWNDLNQNGLQDAGEAGVANSIVTLLDGNGNTVATDTTDTNGAYQFLGVLPADYKVSFTKPANYNYTTKNSDSQGLNGASNSDVNALTGITDLFTLAGGERNNNVDAGMYPKSTIGDKVWNDTNKDGIQDAGEAGISGVTVQLYDSSNNLIASTTTDNNGLYAFANVNPGSYYVKFTAPAEKTFTVKDAGSDDAKDSDADPLTGKTSVFTLTPGQSNFTIDAGLYATPASVGDFVWNDANGNGIQDNGENGLANVTVKLYDNNNNVVATTTTDSTGKYAFNNVIPGNYYLAFTAPANYSFVVKDAGSDDTKDSDADVTTGKTAVFTLNPGQANNTIDAGLKLNPGSIGDFVWNDANGNGIQDSGENGLANVTVKLYDNNNNVVATATTDSTGKYVFSNVTPGSYYVAFTAPANYSFVVKDAGSDDTKDSDADVTTGKTAVFTLNPGQANTTLDAGLKLNPGSIGDFVWNDANGNGIQDNGENGIANVTVKLYDNNNNVVATTTTDSTGKYAFNNVIPGNYYVAFTAPANYSFVAKDAGSDDTKDSDADVTTGKTAVFTLNPGQTNVTIDAGLRIMATDIGVVKTASTQSIACGETFSYTITARNHGSASANGVVIADILPLGLDFLSYTASKGTYNNTTGNWNIGTLDSAQTATLTISVSVNCSAMNLANIDLGPAKSFNVFAMVDFKPSSADVQGKLAVGRDAVLGGYSVGDQLPVSGGTADVLVVGHDLQFTSGAVYGGNVVYGNSSNLPTNAVSINDGSVRKDTVIDFAAAKAYLENLSTALSGYPVNGTTTFQWGTLNLIHSDAYLNVFTVNAADLSTANTVQINVPNGSAVVVNILGNSVNWHGGLFVNGTAMNNVLYNFPQATNVTISGIELRGALLAPFADLNFPAGLISGQAIFKSMTGSGQFNLSPFLGNIPANANIVNVASLLSLDQTDTNPANNSSSVTTAIAPSGGSGSGGSGSSGWQLIGNMPAGETVTCLEADLQGAIYAGTTNGYIYKSTDNGASWTHVNTDMYSGAIWTLEVHPNGSIFAATVTGVFRGTNNGTVWAQTALQNKDVRALKIDTQGTIFAGTWSYGMYVSSDNGASWTQSNDGLGSHLIVTAVTVTPNQSVFAGTFDGGVFKSVDKGANWTAVSVGYNYIWTLVSNASGDLFAGTYGDGLYRSTNNGSTWTKTFCPASYVYELRIDASGNLFAASYSGGVFVSTDNGNTWKSAGMGGMALSSILVVPSGKTMFTGTANGRIFMKATDISGIKNTDNEKPTAFALNQNYPNPFNPSTVVRYALPFEANVVVKVYNVTGQEVAVLANGTMVSGNYEVAFDGKNLSSGLYICTMHAVSADGKLKFNATRKMMLVK